MSRNVEKAQSSLNRHQEQKMRDAGVLESNPSLRPKYVQSVETLAQAEKWRSVVMTEISVRLTRIHDASVSESQVRDLNDELNKLFREKRAWEHHIKSLGGPDYVAFGNNLARTGHSVESVQGHRYFGRARDLPDVKELLKQQQAQRAQSKQSADDAYGKEKLGRERLERIAPGYFSHDGVSATTLDDIRRELGAALGYKSETASHYKSETASRSEASRARTIELTEAMRGPSSATAGDDFDFDAVPSSEQVYGYLVAKKKQELLSRLT